MAKTKHRGAKREGNVIPLHSRGLKPGLDAAKDRAEDARIIAIPPKKVGREEAIAELSEVMGIPADLKSFSGFNLPEKVKVSRFPGGMEMYDTKSRRPAARTGPEDLGPIMKWVKGWYLSVHVEGDKLMGCMIDKRYPNYPHFIIQPIRDPSQPGKYSLSVFVRQAILGQPLI